VDNKVVEIKGRKFVIRKFDARTGSFMLFKVMGIIGPILAGLDLDKIMDKVNTGGIAATDLKGLNIAEIVTGLSSLSESDYNYIYDKCLRVCFEDLDAGPAQVLNNNGKYGVIGLENDAATTLALIAHTLIFNLTSFFDGSPLSSLAGGILGMK